MRSDMSKVVTERPRSGIRTKNPKGYKKAKQSLQIYHYEDSPKFEKIRQKWKVSWQYKEFTDVLGPLRGWLLKQVGRKWDDVYSEICHVLPGKNLQGKHIRDHIDWMVCKHVIIVNGVPCEAEGGRTYMIPLQAGKYHSVVYIDPNTGILQLVPEFKPNIIKKQSKMLKINEKIQLHMLKGIWYECKVKKIDPALYTVKIRRRKKGFHFPTFILEDSIMGKTYIEKYDWYEMYQGPYLAVSKKQLNSKELKKYGLHNDIA